MTFNIALIPTNEKCPKKHTQKLTENNNPLDLNNFPDDHLTKETLDHESSSSSASGIYRKKKNGGKDESGKVYECSEQAVVHGGFHHQAGYNITTTILPAVPPPQPSPRMYTSHPVNDYFLGHVCSGNPPAFSLQSSPAENTNNYTCIGAPVGQSFTLAQGSREMAQSPITRYHQHGF
ncbi:hypothetical protein L1987_61753 [Smallanthus sonchifolius]|uniref:Uncharacterized protein n=1 Tax=Smallanthus sonchifolius TaxID=185202 RepID=A0ACB9C8J1_9ASTR|nr:hypothetical protein L1987_61753 [Smallanthus sonchifolius]